MAPPLDHLRTIVGLKRPLRVDSHDNRAGATDASSPRPLFIRGHVESGVTELGQALNTTASVWCAGTLGLGELTNAVSRAARSAHAVAPAAASELERAIRDAIRRTLSAGASAKPGVRWAADAVEAGIEPILPDAAYILVVRDGRDALVATALRQLREGGPLFTDPRFRARLEHLREELRRDPAMLAERPQRLLWLEPWVRQIARAWASQTQSDLAALDRLASHGARTLVVRYEELAEPASASRRELRGLLALSPDDISFAPPSGPARDIGAWRRFFTPQVADAFIAEAGDALVRLGYEPSDAWRATLVSTVSLDAPAVPQVPAAGPEAEAAIELHADPPVFPRTGADGDLPEHAITLNDRTYQLFFICGHPRSGTTWTVAVLNQHPRIFTQGEFRFEALRNAHDQLTRWPWHVAHHEPVRTEAELAIRDSVRRIMGAISVHRPDAQWLGDKTPRGLRVLIPGAPHVLLVRDGRDVLVSRTFHELSSNGSMLADPLYGGRMQDLQRAFLADPDLFRREPHRLLSEEHWVKALARQWAGQMRHDLAVAKVMRERGRTPLYELRYERMRHDAETERSNLYRFLGLDPAEAAPLDAANRSAPGFEAETPNSFYRKGVVGDWKAYFTDDARRWFKQAAGDQLVALGYERDDSW